MLIQEFLALRIVSAVQQFGVLVERVFRVPVKGMQLKDDLVGVRSMLIRVIGRHESGAVNLVSFC